MLLVEQALQYTIGITDISISRITNSRRKKQVSTEHTATLSSTLPFCNLLVNTRARAAAVTCLALLHIKLLTYARPRGVEHVQVRIRNMYVRTYRYVTYNTSGGARAVVQRRTLSCL